MINEIILCLDFDGVILDSTRECIYVAIEAFRQFNEDFDNNLSDNQIKCLKKLRPMVRGASEYLKAIDIAINNINIKTYHDFSNYDIKNKYTNKELDIYKKLFYEKRKFLIKNNPIKWFKLHDFYQSFIIFLKEFMNYQNDLFFVSLKDKHSISMLMKYKELKNFNEIIDCSVIKSKPEGLDFICKKYKLKKNQILFIDDNPLHINECKENGYENCYLPKWNSNCLKIDSEFPDLNLIDINQLKNFFDCFL